MRVRKELIFDIKEIDKFILHVELNSHTLYFVILPIAIKQWVTLSAGNNNKQIEGRTVFLDC